MANSALQRNPYFNGQARGSFPQQGGVGTATQNGPYQAAPQYQTPYAGQQAPQYGGPTPSADQIGHQFDLPAASNDQMERMSYEDTIAKTAGLFAAVVAAAAATWGVYLVSPLIALVLMGVGAIGTLVLSLVLAFSREPKVPLVWLFAVGEGLLIGGLSALFELGLRMEGIALQAALATFAVVATVLILFRFGKLRTSPKLTKFFFVAMIGYGLFSVANLVGMLLTPNSGMFGWRSDVQIFGIPLGVILGIFAVLMGAYMLVMDFELIANGVKAGAPRKYGWIGAYALVSTVTYIYLEILRVLAILRNN